MKVRLAGVPVANCAAVALVTTWLAGLMACGPSEPEGVLPTENVFRKARGLAEAGDELHLGFGWPDPLVGRFEASTTLVVEETGRPARGVEIATRGRVTSRSDQTGRMVQWSDVRWDKPTSLRGVMPDPVHELHAAVMAAHAGTDLAGRLDGDVAFSGPVAPAALEQGVGEARLHARDAFDQLVKDAAVPAGLRTLAYRQIDRSLSPEAVMRQVAERWSDSVSIWIAGGAWKVGETRSRRVDAPLPFQGGPDVPTSVEATLVRRVPCPDVATETCVLLRVQRRPDADQARAAFDAGFGEVIRATLPPGSVPLSVSGYDLTLLHEVVAIPDNLVPLEERIIVRVDVGLAMGELAGRREEEHALVIRYRWADLRG